MPDTKRSTQDINSCSLIVYELAPSLNGDRGLMRLHWTDYITLRERWIWLVREKGVPQRIYPASVQIVRFYARNPLDLDNLYAAAKVPLDALCETGWLRDDDPDSLVSLNCTQHKVDTLDEERTQITITPT